MSGNGNGTAVATVSGDLSREEFGQLAHSLGYQDMLAPPPASPGELPVNTLREAIPYLRRPFTPSAIRFKVQSTFGGRKDDSGKKYIEPPTAGLIVPYIDARLVMERLNLVCPDLWSERFELFSLGGQGNASALWCHLTIDSVTHSDVGEGKGKALVSDARKRAAVCAGIGVSLYAVPKLILKVEDERIAVRKNFKTGYMLVLTPTHELQVRDWYEAWLEHEGIEKFGAPLDHGDAQDAAGDPNDPDAQDDDGEGQLFEDPEPPKPTGRRISAQRAEQIGRAFHERAPESVTPDDLTQKLEAITGKPVEDAVKAMKELRVSQADEVEAWVEGLVG